MITIYIYMGKNKLDMVNKKTKKKPKNTKKKPKNTKVVDVPLADKVSMGSKASVGLIDYHYQK